MKFSYTLVAALVGVAAASPLGEPSLSKRVDKDKVKSEIQELNNLIEKFQQAKDERQKSTGDGWQQTIDLLKERAAAIEAAPDDKLVEEINKLDEPIGRIRNSRDGAVSSTGLHGE
ncbi:hypothetical protein MAC_07956 [Metarhizium acridum CQMa 102]|uniref:Cell wall protein n=1 Tax=Metarhizium acridum (strain CQMa 102) TaxID=655827 RepID=E9EDK8_METAQ|nr:uncharacterized protein MAC_07956 [Metarhizium acridum CQMa 102]EFY86004.1 hypothetical protein MAC_07956 [Metarhizium acridum CQMa 102]